MQINDANPYLRAVQIQPAVLEGSGFRMAYDHRLFYLLEGEGTLLLEKTEQRVSPGALILLRPGERYYFRGKLRVVVLNYDVTRCCAHRTEPVCPPPADRFRPEMLFDSTVIDGLEGPLLLPNALSFREPLLALAEAATGRDLYTDARVSAMLKALLVDLLAHIKGVPDHDTQLYLLISQYIRLHAAEIKSNEALARVFGYHPVYLGSVFRAKSGKSIHRAILDERIALACRWLRQTDRSVEEIAEASGFASRSHLCAVFRRVTGQTPLAYRRGDAVELHRASL